MQIKLENISNNKNAQLSCIAICNALALEKGIYLIQFSSLQSLSSVWLFATPWTIARQASLSITNSRSLPKLMSIDSVMPSNHFILCHPLPLLPSIFPSIRVFSNESVLHITWPEYWSFSFNISPSNEHPGLISFRMDWLDPLNRGLGDYLCIILIVHNQGILFLKIKLSLQTLYSSLTFFNN